MNVNFGLFPEPENEPGKKRLKGRDRKTLYSIRAREALTKWMDPEAA
jgi:methylenetetrahydrofolate--tRNA-(uracil-5-)-methyltransferase